MNAASQRWTVARLGTAQTLAWASSYYLPAMLAAPMARDLGVATSTVFAAFSVALIVSALLGPFAGRAIDRHGGRPVLVGTNLLFAAALTGMALAQGPVGLFAAWVLMGVAMGSGLYEAAFATLVRLYGQGARGAITGITLIAGFASTVGWPLSAWMETQWGWRGACAGWAALHLLVGVPLNGWLPRADAAKKPPPPSADEPAAATLEPAAPATPAAVHPLLSTRCAPTSCCRLCLPSPGSPAPPWRPTCRACCRPVVRRCKRLWPWRRWWARHRWQHGCWSLVCCAVCTRCCQPNWLPLHTPWARAC